MYAVSLACQLPIQEIRNFRRRPEVNHILILRCLKNRDFCLNLPVVRASCFPTFDAERTSHVATHMRTVRSRGEAADAARTILKKGWHAMKAPSGLATRYSGSLLFVLLVLAVACSDDRRSITSPDQPSIADAVSRLGFDPSGLVDLGDAVVVENDIILSKRALRFESGLTGPRASLSKISIDTTRGLQPKGPVFQWSTTNLVSQSTATQIVVNVSGLESSWQTALRAAMADWNAIGSGVSIQFVEGSPSNITASMTVFGDFSNCSGTAARADFPSGAQPGSALQVSSQFAPCLGASQKEATMVHELGHSIGFRHTDWQGHENAAPEGANLITDTPQTDPYSIMNRAGPAAGWGGFSYYDKVGAFYLYHFGPTGIADSYPGGVPRVSWSAFSYATSWTLDYEYDAEICNGDPNAPCDHYRDTQFVGSAESGSTYISDPSRSYTGADQCSYPNSSWEQANYVLTVIYPLGSGKIIVPARVLMC